MSPLRLWSYGKLSQPTMLLQFVEDQLISRRFSRWTSPFAYIFLAT